MIKYVCALVAVASMTACLVEEPEPEQEAEALGQSEEEICLGVPSADQTCNNTATCFTNNWEFCDSECEFATASATWTSGNRYTQAFAYANFDNHSCDEDLEVQMKVWGKDCAGQLCETEWEYFAYYYGTLCYDGWACVSINDCFPRATVYLPHAVNIPNTYEQVRAAARGWDGDAWVSLPKVRLCKTGTDCDEEL